MSRKSTRTGVKDNVGTGYKFIDLFAGMGGFHKALGDLGAECVFASEMNPFARETYMKAYAESSVVVNHEMRFNIDLVDVTRPTIHYGGRPRQRTNLTKTLWKKIEERIEPFDVLCAGFPCQPFSQAGKKKGFDDSRGNLFYDIERILKVHQPEAIFLENVRNILKHDRGNTIHVIRRKLRGAGYGNVLTPVVWASEHGLPQHRPRVFMIGFRNVEARAHFEAHLPKPKKYFEKRNPDASPLRFTMSDVLGGPVTMGPSRRDDTPRDIGFTLRVGGRMSPIVARQNWDCYMVQGREVRLRPEHGLMMQGFTESTEDGLNWFPDNVNESQAMKLLGNSVAVPAVREYAAVIFDALRAAGINPR